MGTVSALHAPRRNIFPANSAGNLINFWLIENRGRKNFRKNFGNMGGGFVANI